jgi:RimJ/RimL family protein N-acetyltransferase
MLTPDTCSLMHRLRDAELYHFYLGDPVEMLMLADDGAEVVHLGQDLAAGQRVQHLVPGGVWQGSRLLPGGRFALMGTTMTPGFDLANFRLGSRDELLPRFPDHAALLTALTPNRVKSARLELAAATKDLLHADQRGPQILGAGLDAEVPEDWPPPHYDERSIRFTIAQLARDPNQRGWWQWYFVQRDPRVVVGAGGFKGAPNARGEVEIGYAIVESFQNKGYATEAAGALAAHAFEDPRVERVIARALENGAASIRVLEKNGFVSKGIDGVGLRFVKERPPTDKP